MKKKNAALACALLAAGLLGGTAARAADGVVKIGFITDLSGTYADIDGPGGVEAIRMAIEDAGGRVDGKRIELLVADHQNKTDIAANKVREWIDQDKVDVVIGGTNSSVTLAISRIAAEKKRPFLSASSGTTRLTNEECTPYSVQYTYDTVSVARVTAGAMAKQSVGSSWYFLTVDVAFGHSLEKDMIDTIKAAGATVAGVSRHPLGASDFSAFVLQARASKADVLGLATGGNDLVNAIKSANEFGLTKSMKIAAPLMFITDIHAVGLPIMQNLFYTGGWYWDLDDETRTWSRRYFGKMKKMPTDFQAGNYSLTGAYLAAVRSARTTDADPVMAKLKSTKINDMFTKNGYIRPDGRMIHDLYLMQVKAPGESKYPWDYAKIMQKVPGEQAYMTKEESKCALWK